MELAGAFGAPAGPVEEAWEVVAADPSCAALSASQKAALTSLVSDIGVDAYNASRLRQRLAQGDLGRAAAEFPRWIVRGAEINRTMIMRRSAERRLWNGGRVEEEG